MHLAPLIFDLAVILAVAGLMSFLFQKIRQPVVLGYIIAGFIVGPFTPPFQLVTDIQGIQVWAELGVIFLMFTLGLEFSFRKLLNVGLTATVTAILEVGFFLIVGFAIGLALGRTSLESLFLGAMLSISSTTIIIKALSDLKLKTHRFSNLIFGVLIVEDLIAILLLVALTTIASTKSFSAMALLGTTFNLVIVTGSWFIIGHFFVPRMMNYIARKGSSEMMTLVSIGLCLLLVVIGTHFGYSPALGAFIMGSILAETRIINQIENQMAPLRDLFGAIFFVSIGMLIDPKIIWEFKGTIVLLSLVTIFGKIFITSLGSLISGQSFKNSIQVGFGLAQIGEFSFIIASLGVSLKAIGSDLYPIAVAVALITTFTTPYLIKYSGYCADKIEGRLPRKLINILNKYSFWLEHQRASKQDLVPILKLFGRWFLNGIIVTVIFNNSFKGLAPKILFHFPQISSWYLETTWLIAFIVSSPFIWAMIFASKKAYTENQKNKKVLQVAVVISFPLLTSILLATIGIKYFALSRVLPVTMLFVMVMYFWLYRRLETYYGWFEVKFLSSFEKKIERKKSKTLASLAPWDSHLYKFEVHPNAALVNITLVEARLRKRFGINIVAIKRGMKTLVAPSAQEKILPMDTLIVLGTDEQLDSFRTQVEASEIHEAPVSIEQNYLLKHVEISESSLLIGKNIQESQFREHFKVLVVGIERGESRIMNPDKDFIFRSSDIIWLVGEKGQLEEVVQTLA